MQGMTIGIQQGQQERDSAATNMLPTRARGNLGKTLPGPNAAPTVRSSKDGEALVSGSRLTLTLLNAPANISSRTQDEIPPPPRQPPHHSLGSTQTELGIKKGFERKSEVKVATRSAVQDA